MVSPPSKSVKHRIAMPPRYYAVSRESPSWTTVSSWSGVWRNVIIMYGWTMPRLLPARRIVVLSHSTCCPLPWSIIWWSIKAPRRNCRRISPEVSCGCWQRIFPRVIRSTSPIKSGLIQTPLSEISNWRKVPPWIIWALALAPECYPRTPHLIWTTYRQRMRRRLRSGWIRDGTCVISRRCRNRNWRSRWIVPLISVTWRSVISPVWTIARAMIITRWKTTTTSRTTWPRINPHTVTATMMYNIRIRQN